MLRSLCAGAIAGLLLAAPLQAQSARTRQLRHHSLRGLHEVRQSRERSARHQHPRRGRPGVRRRGDPRITRGIALVGNVAYASSDLEVGLPIVGGLSFGRSSALMYDAALRLSVPLGGRRDQPVRAGGRGRDAAGDRGGTRLDPVDQLRLQRGAGVDVPLGSRLGLQLMAKDYIGKFDAREATALDVNTETTHNWTRERRGATGPVDRCERECHPHG